MKVSAAIAMASAALLMGCNEEAGPAPGSLEEMGVTVVRPYPEEGAVCVVVGEGDRTRDYLSDSATLIACPRASEEAEMAERGAKGAKPMADIGDWVLISVPD